MEKFAPALRRVARELDLPGEARTAILVELASDLEAVFEHYRSRGLSEAEALHRAEGTVLGETEVVHRLARLHRGSRRGWPGQVGARLSGGLDLVLMGAAVVPMMALAAATAAGGLPGAGPAGWAASAAGAGVVFIALAEAVRLAGGRPVRPDRMPPLLVLSAMAAAAGVLAAVLGLRGAASAIVAGGGAVSPPLALAARAARDGATLLLGLLVGLAGVLSWFVLSARSYTRVAREVSALLDPEGTYVPPEPNAGQGIHPLVRRQST